MTIATACSAAGTVAEVSGSVLGAEWSVAEGFIEYLAKGSCCSDGIVEWGGMTTAIAFALPESFIGGFDGWDGVAEVSSGSVIGAAWSIAEGFIECLDGGMATATACSVVEGFGGGGIIAFIGGVAE